MADFLQEIIPGGVKDFLIMGGFPHLVRVLQHLEDLGSQGSVAGQAYVEANMLQHSLGSGFLFLGSDQSPMCVTKYNLVRLDRK